MSNEETTEPETQPTASVEDTTPVKPEPPAPVTRPDPAARDAAKYRRRAHEAEAERDQLAEQSSQTASALYESSVKAMTSNGARLTHPDDLSRFTGKSYGDYMKDGQIDTQALQTDVDQLAKDRPELFTKINYAPRPDHSQGKGGDEFGKGNAWLNAFKIHG